MNNYNRLLVSVFALGLTLAALPSAAHACSCAPPPAPKAALEAADVVFVGTVLAADKVRDPNGGLQVVNYTFEVSHSYKDAKEQVSVLSNESSAACGRTFTRGETYLVYASASDEGLRDSACSRSRLVANADDDFAAIGRPPGDFGGLIGEATVGPARIDVITSQCDVVVEGEMDSASFAEVLGFVGSGGFVCTRDVSVTGNVQIKYAGVRIVSLTHHGLSFLGNLVVSQPAVLIGASVSGTTIITERAEGSVFVANTFEGPMLTATTGLLGIGSVCKTTCAGPGGAMDLGNFIPVSARGLVRQVPTAKFVPADSVNPDGAFAGWMPVDRQPRPKLEDKPVLKTVDPGDLTNDWPPTAAMPGGPSDADVPWIPVYGDLMDGQDNWGVFVPLTVGNFREPSGGFVLVP